MGARARSRQAASCPALQPSTDQCSNPNPNPNHAGKISVLKNPHEATAIGEHPMAATLRTAASGDDDTVDLFHARRSLGSVGRVLGRLAGALVLAEDVLGVVDSFRGAVSDILGGMSKTGDGGGGGGGTLGNGGRPIRSMRPTHCHKRQIHKKGRADVELVDLPEDVLCRIFSKLQLSEVVRTSVLSSKWRHMWVISSKLSLVCSAMCGQQKYSCQRLKYTQEFINSVNAIMQQHHVKVVDELEVKVEFDSVLVDHLNNWVSFAVSSQTKNLAFDLVPADCRCGEDRYIFPFDLLDSESVSRMQHIQLSFVSFKPPGWFWGFKNLKKLDLHLLDVTRKDLQDMLSGCSNLEWLSLVRCHRNDELKVKQPLARLLYLRIAHCNIINIELHAENLNTFVYHGERLPIDLSQVKELETVKLVLYCITFEYVLIVLPTVLPSVRNMTLDACLALKIPLLLENVCKFSQLKILRLRLLIDYDGIDNTLSLKSFLSAAPFIETLEMHFGSYIGIVERRTVRSLPRCRYNHLRNVHITGFKGTKGQVEFLVHTVENAPALEVLTIDPKEQVGVCLSEDAGYSAYRAAARRSLDGKISPHTKLYIH